MSMESSMDRRDILRALGGCAALSVAPPLFAAESSHDGKPWAFIEVGSSGVKPSIVRIKAGLEPDLEVMRTFEPTEANAIDPGNAPVVAEAVAKAIAQIKATGMAFEAIKVVGSSGVASKADVREAVAKAVAERTGIAMKFVSVKQETEYTFDGVVNRVRLSHRRPQVTLIDIGSGNTKGCYISTAPDASEQFHHFSMDYGTKSFARKVSSAQGEDESFEKAANRLADTDLRAEIRKMVISAGAIMAQRNRIYLNGGLPWVLATTQAPLKTDRYVPLMAADVDRFCTLAQTDQAKLFAVDTSVIPAGAHKDVIVGDLARMSSGKVFTPEELKAGAALLRVLSEELVFARKTLFFTRPGRLAWIMGLAFFDAADGKISKEVLPN